MNRKSMLVAAAVAALLALPAQQALAAGFSHGGGGGGGGGMASHGGGGGGGWHGGGGNGGGGNWHGGGSGDNWHGGGSWHGGNHWHGGYWGPGLGFYFGAPWFAAAWGYPYYPYYPYGYGYGPGYGSSTIIYDDAAPATWGPAPADSAPPSGYPQPNVIPAPNQYRSAPAQAPVQFQYYCPDSGYYPAVRTCPRGWVQQAPHANAPAS